MQSQKIQSFCVADFATLSNERRSRSKIVPLFNVDKRPCIRKFEGLTRFKNRGILQTEMNYLFTILFDLTLFWTGSGRTLYWMGGGGKKAPRVNSAI